jgi:hypothetical protein
MNLEFNETEAELLHKALYFALSVADFGDEIDNAYELLDKVKIFLNEIEEKETTILEPDCWQDYLIDNARDKEGWKIDINGKVYIIGDVEEFIGEYGKESTIQVLINLKQATLNGLLIEVKA